MLLEDVLDEFDEVVGLAGRQIELDGGSGHGFVELTVKLGGTERGSIISLEPVDQEHGQVNGKLEPATERLEKPGKKPEQVSCLTSGSVTGTSQPPGSRPD